MKKKLHRIQMGELVQQPQKLTVDAENGATAEETAEKFQKLWRLIWVKILIRKRH
jgi:hypothetical protein